MIRQSSHPVYAVMTGVCAIQSPQHPAVETFVRGDCCICDIKKTPSPEHGEGVIDPLHVS